MKIGAIGSFGALGVGAKTLVQRRGRVALVQKMWAVCARLFAARYGLARQLPSERCGIGTAGLARPVEARQVGKFDRDLLAALYKLGFDITDDKIAKIKGDMTIRLLRPFDGLLKIVVELPGGKEMICDLDEHTQVEIIEATKHRQ